MVLRHREAGKMDSAVAVKAKSVDKLAVSFFPFS